MISPDGGRYLAMARGEGAPFPFHLRWLIPSIARENINRWRWIAAGGWALFVGGAGILGGWPAALLVAVLPGPGIGFRLPVLVDAAALAAAMMTAIAGPIWLQIGLAIIAGCVSERAPIFAALWAWSPLPLVGLLAPGIRWAFYSPGPECAALRGTLAAEVVRNPWQCARRDWHDLGLILPWGGLLAALAWLDLRMGLTLALAYAQLAVATDAARLYQWAAPVLAVAIAQHLDWRYCVILALITWFNPYRGNGV